MYNLKEYLGRDGCLGIVRSVAGETKVFRRRGVADLLELCGGNPEFLEGASAADKVIGRGAAMLLVKGKVKEVYAEVISSGALQALRSAGISVAFGTETPYIINRAGTGMCPVEQLVQGISSADEAYEKIKSFIAERASQQSTR